MNILHILTWTVALHTIFQFVPVMSEVGGGHCGSNKWGPACDRYCSSNCRPFINKIHCDVTTGECLEGCNVGYHGTTCLRECNSNCINNTCSQVDGECSFGCKDNTSCIVTAPPTNTPDTDITQTHCDFSSYLGYIFFSVLLTVLLCALAGYFFVYAIWRRHIIRRNKRTDEGRAEGLVEMKDQQCPVGFYGSSCKHPCPRNCKSKQCKINDAGHPSCIYECVDGYRGTSCKIPCPGNCQLCERFTDGCTRCKDAFHGTNCTLTCEELCQGFLCDTDKTCSKTACLDGRYGQNCSNKCSPRCLTCARSTGNCTACGDGYYGQFCELDCPRCGFTNDSVDQTCKDGCNTTSCSDIKHGESGSNILLYVLILVVLLLSIVTAVLSFLLRRSCNTIIRMKKELSEALELLPGNADVNNARPTSANGPTGPTSVETNTPPEDVNNARPTSANGPTGPTSVETNTPSEQSTLLSKDTEDH